MAALHSTLEGLAAYRKYAQDDTDQVWHQPDPRPEPVPMPSPGQPIPMPDLPFPGRPVP